MKYDLNKQRKELAKISLDLIKNIVEGHTKSLLEEVHDQIKTRDTEIKKLKGTLGKLISWNRLELGDSAVKQLLEELDNG